MTSAALLIRSMFIDNAPAALCARLLGCRELLCETIAMQRVCQKLLEGGNQYSPAITEIKSTLRFFVSQIWTDLLQILYLHRHTELHVQQTGTCGCLLCTAL